MKTGRGLFSRVSVGSACFSSTLACLGRTNLGEAKKLLGEIDESRLKSSNIHLRQDVQCILHTSPSIIDGAFNFRRLLASRASRAIRAQGADVKNRLRSSLVQ